MTTYAVTKRLMDIMVGLVVLILTAPIWLLASVWLYLSIGSPIYFKQKRIGYKGQEFTILKFRTMSNQKDANGQLLPDDLRLTGVGKWIRSLSIDELPQLLNVLKGDMSLVGPRPLLTRYSPLYSEEQFRRHTVKPGITGWAQINGRNAISWTERFRKDIYYVDNYSLKLDAYIIFKTLQRIIQRSDIAENGEATMTEFNGKN